MKTLRGFTTTLYTSIHRRSSVRLETRVSQNTYKQCRCFRERTYDDDRFFSSEYFVSLKIKKKFTSRVNTSHSLSVRMTRRTRQTTEVIVTSVGERCVTSVDKDARQYCYREPSEDPGTREDRAFGGPTDGRAASLGGITMLRCVIVTGDDRIKRVASDVGYKYERGEYLNPVGSRHRSSQKNRLLSVSLSRPLLSVTSLQKPLSPVAVLSYPFFVPVLTRPWHLHRITSLPPHVL